MARARHIETLTYRPPLQYALDLEVMTVDELRSRMPPGQRHFVHRIQFHMLVLVTRGRFSHMIDFEYYPCANGTLLALRPGQVQRFERAPGWQGWVAMFRPEFLLPLQGPAVDVQARERIEALPTSLELAPRTMDAAVEGLRRIHDDAGVLPPTVETGALLRHQLYALLLRLAIEAIGRRALGAGTAASLQRFRRFQAAVERDYVREHGLAGYARRLGCSERSLTRAALESAGVGAKAYLVNRIVLEAKRLLAHTVAPVANIAVDLGFAEATNFVKFFRREAGCSPGEFRRQQAEAGMADSLD
jgi:AraC-like DNA-binding protein